jgi:hypothetical protein
VAPFLQRQEPDKESVENMQMTNLKIRAREGMTIRCEKWNGNRGRIKDRGRESIEI